MIAEKLRKAVLQAAMEGKLTNQDLNDNSVVEILTKIEMNKGIKFRVINEDEKPYSIPMNWVWISHNDILEISGGSQPPKSTFSELPKENYIRLYQIRDYGSNPQPVYIPIETATKQTKKGDILLARYGASLGKVFYAEEGAYNVAMAKVIPLFKEDILYNDFLFYYYKSSQYQSLVLNNTRSAQAGFNKNDLNKLLIALPPIEEQKRIVEKLEVLLAEIDKLEQDEKALKDLEDKFPERLKNSILQAAIQGRISNQSIDKDNSYNHSGINGNKQITYEENDKTGLVVPTTWRFYKLVDVSDVIGGYAFKSSEYLKSNIENGVRVIRISDFNNDGLIDNSPVYYNEDNKLSRYEIRENDILLCMTGGTVGKNTLVNNIDKKLYLNQRVAAIRNNSPSLLNTEYLHIVLNTPYIQKIINDSKNSTNDNISMRQINNFIIPIPPLKEQIEIINKIKKLSINIETM